MNFNNRSHREETCIRMADGLLPQAGTLKICEVGALGGTQRRIDEATLSSIVRNADEAIPVYLMEATYMNVVSAANAAGWVVSLETRDGGKSLHGRVEWTDRGRKSAGGRYIVPVVKGKNVDGIGPVGTRLAMLVLILKPAGKFAFQPIDVEEVTMKMREAKSAQRHQHNRVLVEAERKATWKRQRELTDRLIAQGMTYEAASAAASNRIRLGIPDET